MIFFFCVFFFVCLHSCFKISFSWFLGPWSTLITFHVLLHTIKYFMTPFNFSLVHSRVRGYFWKEIPTSWWLQWLYLYFILCLTSWRLRMVCDCISKVLVHWHLYFLLCFNCQPFSCILTQIFSFGTKTSPWKDSLQSQLLWALFVSSLFSSISLTTIPRGWS